MRNIINLNENWKFIQKNVGLPSVYPTDWESVDLPHTWNAVIGAIIGMQSLLKLQSSRWREAELL